MTKRGAKSGQHGAGKSAKFFGLLAAAWLGLVAAWPEGFEVKIGTFSLLSYPSWSQWWAPKEEVMTAEAVMVWLEEEPGNEGTKEPGNEGTKEPGNEGTKEPGNEGTTRKGLDPMAFLTANDEARGKLSQLFAALEAREFGGRAVHVFHFGDSQIEGDRFTATIRERMQTAFGGGGPGWLSVSPPSPSFTVNLRVDDPERWTRQTRYMTADSLISDERYGWMAARSVADSGARFTIRPHPRCNEAARTWNRLEVVWDASADTVPISWQVAGGGMWMDTVLLPAQGLGRMRWHGEQAQLPISVALPAGLDRLLHVGMWLDSTGVVVHNVPMRGSSGTLFRRLDASVLADQTQDISPALVFLQFGGNTVPYLRDAAAAERYGRWFASNLRQIRALMPDAAFVIIGNADMAENINGQWLTKPMVEPTRDALRQAALLEDAVFFDVFEAMGGKHSMGGWVNTSPPLAGADHVHFTRRGARVLAELLMDGLFGLAQENATP